MNAATVLRDLADLLDDHQSLPAPTSIMLGGDQPRVHVDAADIGWWLTALELPEPEWHGDASEQMMFARWPIGTFEDASFRLVCIATEPAAAAS